MRNAERKERALLNSRSPQSRSTEGAGSPVLPGAAEGTLLCGSADWGPSNVSGAVAGKEPLQQVSFPPSV